MPEVVSPVLSSEANNKDKRCHMYKLVANILVPIQLNEEHISVLKQAAELAREHDSIIHLLYVEPVTYTFSASWISKLLNPTTLFARLKEKLELMATWKRWLEIEYGIQATCTADWGNWKKIVVKHVSLLNADLVILKHQQLEKHWFSSIVTSSIGFIIRKSKCQVLTLFSNKNTIAEWTQVVIPVTGFIPHARILTLIKSIKAFDIKIHLITLSGNESQSGFYFLTESLKFLKLHNNIQVECRYVKDKFNSPGEYMKYSQNIEADALITNTFNQASPGKLLPPNSNRFQEIFCLKRNSLSILTS